MFQYMFQYDHAAVYKATSLETRCVKIGVEELGYPDWTLPHWGDLELEPPFHPNISVFWNKIFNKDCEVSTNFCPYSVL